MKDGKYEKHEVEHLAKFYSKYDKENKEVSHMDYKLTINDDQLFLLIELVNARIANLTTYWQKTGHRDEEQWNELFGLSVMLKEEMEANIATELDGE